MKMSSEPPEPEVKPEFELSDLQKEEIELMEKAVGLYTSCLNDIQALNIDFWAGLDMQEVLDDLAYMGADFEDYITLEE